MFDAGVSLEGVGKANDVEATVARNCCRLSGLLCRMTGGECECVFLFVFPVFFRGVWKRVSFCNR